MEADVEFVASKPAVKIVEEVIPAEMNITMKQDLQYSFKTLEEISPMEMTIEKH
jgi:cell division protein FtsZ